MGKISIEIGKIFNRWTVIGYKKEKKFYYESKCSCGIIKLLGGYDLKSGKSKGCSNCYLSKKKPFNRSHGMSKTSTYQIWFNMKRRCFDPKTKCFKHYGGRGITVCDRWLTFENFFEDMGLRPDKLELDRINNNGNYEPSNCRWTTHKINSNNRRDVCGRRKVL